MVGGPEWEWLLRRLASLAQPPASWCAAVPESMQRAAVLVPLVERNGTINVVLTRRSEWLRRHAGQISFPGGRMEAFDATPAQTALRESHEEIGAIPRDTRILGYLEAYNTGTGFIIMPSIGLLDPRIVFRCCPREVAEVFEVPLSFILDSSNHRAHIITRGDGDYRLGALPFGDYFIWGATAGILLHLYSAITGRTAVVDPQGELISGDRMMRRADESR